MISVYLSVSPRSKEKKVPQITPSLSQVLAIPIFSCFCLICGTLSDCLMLQMRNINKNEKIKNKPQAKIMMPQVVPLSV